MKAIVPSVGLLFLSAVVAVGIGTAETPDVAVQVTSVSVERVADAVTVRIRTSGQAKYQSSLIDSPNRLVIDLPGPRHLEQTNGSTRIPIPWHISRRRGRQLARVVFELRSSSSMHRRDAEGLLIFSSRPPRRRPRSPPRSRARRCEDPLAAEVAEAASPAWRRPLEARAADP